MEKQKQGQLLAKIRTRLYACCRETLVVLARSMDDDAPEDLSQSTALEGIEKRLEACRENDDGGEVFLSRLLDTLKSVNVKCTSAENVNSKSTNWRKEFKIAGQIGDSASSMGYMSFLRQVESGVEQGFPEHEIVTAVIKSIHSTVRLRGYLESREGLTLSVTQSLVRAFYKERSSTELYQELCNLKQESKETVQELVFRALELRQKIIFASKENGALSYDPQLVEEQFRYSLSTGVRDEIIRAELSTLLNSYQHDEDLIAGLNAITRRCAEKENKFGGNRDKNSVVNVISIEESDIIRELRALRSDVSEMKRQMNIRPATVYGPRQERSRGPRQERSHPEVAKGGRKCQNCIDHRIEGRCPHCFKCGGEGHFAFHCTQASENW